MFDPDGYLPAPYIVAWVAKMAADGNLARRMPPDSRGIEFSPPGPALQVDARSLIGGMLAAGKLVAEAMMHTDGSRRIIPAQYWSSPAGRETMISGFVDMSFFGYEQDLLIVEAIMAVDDVSAALGFRSGQSREFAEGGTSPRSMDRDGPKPHTLPSEGIRESSATATAEAETASADDMDSILLSWMESYLRDFLHRHGTVAKREAAVTACRDATGKGINKCRAAFAAVKDRSIRIPPAEERQKSK